jgi:hypothetical protein
MTETLTQQADQNTSLRDRNLIISPTAIGTKITSEEVPTELSTESNIMLSYAIYNCITLDDRLNSLLQNSNIDNLITAHNLLCQKYPSDSKIYLLHETIISKQYISLPILNKNGEMF